MEALRTRLLARIEQAAATVSADDTAARHDLKTLRTTVGVAVCLCRVRGNRTEEGLRSTLYDISQMECPLTLAELELVDDRLQWAASWLLKEVR